MLRAALLMLWAALLMLWAALLMLRTALLMLRGALLTLRATLLMLRAALLTWHAALLMLRSALRGTTVIACMRLMYLISILCITRATEWIGTASGSLGLLNTDGVLQQEVLDYRIVTGYCSKRSGTTEYWRGTAAGGLGGMGAPWWGPALQRCRCLPPQLVGTRRGGRWKTHKTLQYLFPLVMEAYISYVVIWETHWHFL